MLSNNLLFSHFLGLSEMLGPVSFQKIFRRSLLLGILVLLGGGLFASVRGLLLVPFHLEVLTTLFLVLSLAAGYWAYTWVRLSSRHEDTWPDPKEFLFHTLLLGGILLVSEAALSAWEYLAFGLASVVGYALALVFLHAVFQRMAREKVPVLFQGLPFQLFSAGLVWLILSGLDFHFGGTAG
jgi:Na+-translocating ferredoxin:NAD+ oxidoreductase RnfA subunit